jgi:hypothetical protein
MKKLIFITLMMITVKGWADTVAIDSQTASVASAGTTPLTWNMTVGSGANRFLVVGCYSSRIITSVSYAGISMSQLRVDSGPAFLSYMFTLVNPASGSNAFSVAYTGGDDTQVLCGATSFTGVNQSSPIDVSTGAYNTPGGGAETVTWTTNIANDMLLDILAYNETANPTPGASQTLQWRIVSSGQGVSGLGSTKPTTTPGSQTMTWTTTNTAVQSAVAIAPAPPPGGTLIIR